MSNGDRRSVATDALATLGTIIDDTQKRDAIHLAVEPVIAGESLMPGEHITVTDGIAYGTDISEGLGIVDPFLTKRVQKGERFWFVMYPRMVHSLRHVWTHPAFPDEKGAEAPDVTTEENKAVSEQWLRDFVSSQHLPSYEEVLKLALESDSDDYICIYDRDAHCEIPPEFWVHVEIVTGQKIPHAHRATFFTCTC